MVLCTLIGGILGYVVTIMVSIREYPKPIFIPIIFVGAPISSLFTALIFGCIGAINGLFYGEIIEFIFGDEKKKH